MLEQIMAATRATVETRKHLRPGSVVAAEAATRTPRPDLFLAGVGRPDRLNVIAECKRRSPSRGVLREDYDVVGLARSYEAAGAAAVSVLTEPSFFDGSLGHLREVRDAVALPLLRKDFVVDEYQIDEARAAGADAVLLIVAVLGRELEAFLRRSDRGGLAALVEVHDEQELQRSIDAGARIIGVNARDLRTMRVDPETCIELAARVPSDIVAVAESGIRTPSDIARLRAAGYAAFLVGEQLVRSPDPARALWELTHE
jgi:indole-3-glycerol phosphate synthase